MSLLKKIEKLLNFDSEIKFDDAKLADGTAIRITGGLVLGSTVQIINTDGTLTFPEAGDLTLADGSVISVDANGVIGEIATPATEAAEGENAKTPQDPAETAMAAPAADATPADAAAPAEAPDDDADADNALGTRVDALESKVGELIDAVNALTQAMNMNAGEMKSVKSENEDLKVKLSKKESAKPALHKKIELSETSKVSNNKTKTMLERVIAIKENNI